MPNSTTSFSRLYNKLKDFFFGHSKLFIGFAAALLISIGFLIVQYLSGNIPDFFLGEEFYILHYAENYNFGEAIRMYFVQNGRFFEGVYWTLLYKTIGYHPALARIFSYLLLLTGAVLCSIAFIRVWPKNKKTPFVLFLLVILIFFNPQAFHHVDRFSGDNSRLAIAGFFIAVLLIQQWFRSGQRIIYLILAFVVHLIVIFTYESTTLLLPAAFLLGLPLLKREQRNAENYRKIFVIAVLSELFALIPYFVYLETYTFFDPYLSHPVIASARDGTVAMLLRFFPSLGNYFLNMGNNQVLTSGPIFPLVVLLLLVAVGILALRNLPVAFKEFSANTENRGSSFAYVCIYTGALWIFFFGLFPFVLGGIDFGASRVYATSFMMLPVMLLLLFEFTQVRVLQILMFFLVVPWFLMSIQSNQRQTAIIFSHEDLYNRYYISLKEIVPAVKPRTAFVLVDYDFFKWGCGPSFMMLYSTRDLSCIWVSSTNKDYVIDRYGGVINAHQGGWEKTENFILVGRQDDGTAFLVDSISPKDDYLINWYSKTPIATDYRRIEPADLANESGMMKSLLNRREILDQESSQ